jgi:4-hydroxybenzoate polyprenyltransferase
MFPILRRLLELIRFSHTLFALPFALLSAALAWHREGVFRWLDLMGILLCMVFARSAAMAFNRLVDRRIDALNPRTAVRHLPAGTLSVFVVATFTVCESRPTTGRSNCPAPCSCSFASTR